MHCVMLFSVNKCVVIAVVIFTAYLCLARTMFIGVYDVIMKLIVIV